jgi:hypothetical protein
MLVSFFGVLCPLLQQATPSWSRASRLAAFLYLYRCVVLHVTKTHSRNQVHQPKSRRWLHLQLACHPSGRRLLQAAQVHWHWIYSHV